MKEFAEYAAIMIWLAGVVLAKGFWIAAAAIFFPPFALYLIVEKIMVVIGWA